MTEARWLAAPLPFCAACCEYTVRFHTAYFCEVCVPTVAPKIPAPPARMALDKPITTTGGEA